MRRLLIWACLMVLGGCATGYRIPSNRFITPESNGGAFHGQVEMQHTSATEVTFITDNGVITSGVYEKIPRTGYMYSNSFFDSFDFIWSHTGGANSMVGGKFQLYGGSRTAKAMDHKVGIAALIGGNAHAPRDKSLDFRLDGQEFLLMYGYRFSEMLMPYLSFGQSNYKFTATQNSPYPEVDGNKIAYRTNAMSLNLGVDGSFQSFFGKLECSYQQLKTTDTKNKTNINFGISVGVNW